MSFAYDIVIIIARRLKRLRERVLSLLVMAVSTLLDGRPNFATILFRFAVILFSKVLK